MPLLVDRPTGDRIFQPSKYRLGMNRRAIVVRRAQDASAAAAIKRRLQMIWRTIKKYLDARARAHPAAG
jgi:hypothetical protein